MTITAIPRLRPMGLGELLDQAIRLYRRNFLTFIGIVAIVQTPIMLLQMLTSLLAFGGLVTQMTSPEPLAEPADIFGPSYFVGLAGTFLLGIVGFLLIQGIAAAAVARAATASYLGQSTSIIDAYRQIGPFWWQLIGSLLLAGVLGIGLLIWLLVPCVGWVTGFGMIIFFWLVIVPLIAPIVVLEKQTVKWSIRRAWDLARQRFWWVLGFMFLLNLFAQLVITGPVALVTFLFQILAGNPMLADNPEATFTLQTVIQSLVSLVFSLTYLPVQLSGVTLLYFDLRVRTEGLDLALLAESTATSQTKITALTEQAPQPERSNFSITTKEFGYFALISLGGAALYFLIIMFIMMLGFAAVLGAGMVR